MAIKININKAVRNAVNFKINVAGAPRQVLQIFQNINGVSKIVWSYLMKVTFNANGGSTTSTKDVGYGTAVGTLPTPTKYEYSLTGFWTLPTGGTKISPSTLIYNNITYYAQWLSDWIYKTGQKLHISATEGGKSGADYSTTTAPIKVENIFINLNYWNRDINNSRSGDMYIDLLVNGAWVNVYHESFWLSADNGGQPINKHIYKTITISSLLSSQLRHRWNANNNLRTIEGSAHVSAWYEKR